MRLVRPGWVYGTERSQADFFFPVRSSERVGLRM